VFAALQALLASRHHELTLLLLFQSSSRQRGLHLSCVHSMAPLSRRVLSSNAPVLFPLDPQTSVHMQCCTCWTCRHGRSPDCTLNLVHAGCAGLLPIRWLGCSLRDGDIFRVIRMHTDGWPRSCQAWAADEQGHGVLSLARSAQFCQRTCGLADKAYSLDTEQAHMLASIDLTDHACPPAAISSSS
jgi:hypothetical protein